ncbi:hypothetical protein LTR85_009758 [Meristemomyces frigidus]|nr:hypothetical protein LTR85_009758 [Meristemomyces frigidus]
MQRFALTLLVCLLAFLAAANWGSQQCARPNETSISYRGDGRRLPTIYKDLVTCPKIESLDLDLGWSGCTPPSDPWLFNFREGDRFPALQKLSLSGYDLADRGRWPRYNRSWWSAFQDLAREALGEVLPQWTLDALFKRESNLDRWLRAMDFTKLEELHLGNEQDLFYERMEHELPALKRLSLELRNTGATMPEQQTDFLREIPSLESLSIWIGAPWEYAAGDKNRTQFPLLEIIEHHCPTLRRLSLHQGETNNPAQRRPMLSLDDLSLIRTSCPELNHLGLDLDRDESTGWPNATLNAMLQFPNLTSLDIGLEIGADLHSANEPGDYDWDHQGLNGPGPFREPRMSLEVSETLFGDFRSNKQGMQLREVVFVVGDYTELSYMGPIYYPSWEDDRARIFICENNSTDEARDEHCEVIGD